MTKKTNRIQMMELLDEFTDACVEPIPTEEESTPTVLEEFPEPTPAPTGEPPAAGVKPKRRDFLDQILPTPQTTSRFTVDLTPEQQKILARAARATGTSKSVLVRGMISVLEKVLQKRQ